MYSETYVYQKEIDWSVLNDGFTLPQQQQVIFLQKMGRFLERGESKQIHFFMCGKTYDVKIVNMNNPVEKRRKDAYQIRYSKNSDFSQTLRHLFRNSYHYLETEKNNQNPDNKKRIVLPDTAKEYLAIYTTEYDDTFLIEPIFTDDIQVFNEEIKNQTERKIETDFDYEIVDKTSGIEIQIQTVKVRKLNRAIGANLKLLYGYRCQICGKVIGEEYGSHIAEAHHIDYFIKSMNNDASNLLVVCPNHHSIIHDANPVFDRRKLTYKYENGYEEKLEKNLHL